MIGTVYLLCDPSTNLFKIGMTRKSVTKRVDELQTGNSCEIHIVKVYKTNIPSFLESSLHHRFCGKQKLNEWYELDIEDIKRFEEYCKFYEDVAKVLQDNPYFKYRL